MSDPHQITEVLHCDLPARQRKGVMIALNANIIVKRDSWYVVPSTSSARRYDVLIRKDENTCSCEDFQTSKQKCKHIYAVEFLLGYNLKKTTKIGRKFLSKDAERIKRPTYPQNWPAYNKTQTNEQDTFQILLRDLCRTIKPIPQKTGRPRHSLSDIVFGLVFKVYSTVSGRRFTSDLRGAKNKECVTEAAHYNSLFRYMGNESITPILYQLIELSALPLIEVEVDFAIDATKFSTRRFFRGAGGRVSIDADDAPTVALNASCGVKTHIITSARVLMNNAHESPTLPDLVYDTYKNFNIAEVSADKGYVSTANMVAITGVGATPYIPFRSNAKGEGGLHDTTAEAQLVQKLYHHFSLHREEFLKHYHKRSNAESTFSMMKAKFGNALRSKKDGARQNEVLCKVLCHNLYVLCQQIDKHGIPLDSWAAAKIAS